MRNADRSRQRLPTYSGSYLLPEQYHIDLAFVLAIAVLKEPDEERDVLLRERDALAGSAPE